MAAFPYRIISAVAKRIIAGLTFRGAVSVRGCRRAAAGFFRGPNRGSGVAGRFPGATLSRVLYQIHFNCSMTVPSEIVGRATVLLAFLAIHSRAARVLSSAPALSW